MREDPRIARGNGVARDAAPLPGQRIKPAHLRTDERLHLLELHVVQPEAALLPRAADGLLHIRDRGEYGVARLLDLEVPARTHDIVGGDVNVALQKRFVVRLQRAKQLLQRTQVFLDLKAFGINARGAPLSAQLDQRVVDAADRLDAIHWLALDNDLRAGDGHNAREPCVAHQRRIIHHAEVVRDDVVHLDAARLDVYGLGLCPLGIVLRIDLVDLVFIEVQRVGVFEKDCQLLVVQAMNSHLALREIGQRVVDL